jgi:hypothetical protein
MLRRTWYGEPEKANRRMLVVISDRQLARFDRMNAESDAFLRLLRHHQALKAAQKSSPASLSPADHLQDVREREVR